MAQTKRPDAGHIPYVFDYIFKKFTPFYAPILKHFSTFALQPMGTTSKRHNSVPVKDNCALCLPTPYFRGRAI